MYSCCALLLTYTRRSKVSFCLSFHLQLLSPSGTHWLDDAPRLSCKDSTRQYAVDDPLLSCNQVPTRERPLVSGPMIG